LIRGFKTTCNGGIDESRVDIQYIGSYLLRSGVTCRHLFLLVVILPLIALSMASSGDIRHEKFIKKELKALKRICKIKI